MEWILRLQHYYHEFVLLVLMCGLICDLMCDLFGEVISEYQNIRKELIMFKKTKISVLLLLCFTTVMLSGIAMGADNNPIFNAYTIGKGDILRIAVWKEPELSVESIAVRLDGKITFPLLNDVQAEGLMPMELKAIIEKGLNAYVASPIVTVILLEPVSQKYYILGEIADTGEYSIVKNLTVMQAFAVAGGFTEWAAKKEILLFRVEDGREKLIRINYKDIVKGKNFKANVSIQADDIIIVP